MAISFEYQWMDPAGAKGAELRATWAQLEISIDGHVVTRAFDSQSRTVRPHVFLPLYPLAEWIVTNWWFLLNEMHPRGSIDGRDFASRHSLRAAAEGYALPKLVFTPSGSTVRATWSPVDLAAQQLAFTELGRATIATPEFANSMLSFARAVSSRLQALGVTDTLLDRELLAIETIDEDEAQFCAAAAALGLDPFSISDEAASQIVETASGLPDSLSQEFFVVADSAQLGEQRHLVDLGIDAIKTNQADLGALRGLRDRRPTPLSGSQPWKQGYRFARHLRSVLGISNSVIRSLSDLSDVFKVKTAELSTATMPILPFGSAFEAIVDSNAVNSPTFAVVKRNEPGTMFTVCRGLFEYLTGPESGAAIVTQSRSDRQKRNRAFAAEFLVPAAQLKPLIDGPEIAGESIDDLALHFGASSAVIRHQIQNHSLAHVVD